MQAPLKVGLIGLGRMGQNHLRVLSMLKNVELVFVADASAPLARRMGEAHTTLGLDDPSSGLPLADAVVICTPTSTHAEMIQTVARHVSHIFVEKPMAESLAQAHAVAAFAESHHIHLQVGFIERFNPAVQGLKSILDQSNDVVSIDFTRTNKLSSRITDVDVVTDLMIHDIDLALHLNGPARQISAHGYVHKDKIDFASALITHANGRFSRIQASRITDKKMRLIQATCLEKFVDCDLLRKEIIINRQSEVRQGEGMPYTVSAIQETVEVHPQEALLSQLRTFISTCLGEQMTGLPNAASALEALRICDQIQKAVLQ